jgi:putative peptide maturation dehydrogenase
MDSMRQVKRSSYLYFYVEDDRNPDLVAFLQGRLEFTARILALTLLTPAKILLTEQELRLIAGLPAHSWSPVDEVVRTYSVDRQTLRELVHQGLLLSDGQDEVSARFRRIEDRLQSLRWHPLAALYHFMTRVEETKAIREDEDLASLAENAAETAARYVDRFGPPPSPFHRLAPDDGQRIELPLLERTGGLFDALLGRQTIRAFDPDRAMSLEDFTHLLRYVFGCHGTCYLSPDVEMLRKTSPSGGSLHPIEAYPLVLGVEGVDSGLYHYDVAAHALEPLRRIELPRARQLAAELCNGQSYAGSAHALFVLTARWPRNFWKYRRRSRTYGVILMDAGHLSQSFYLVAADLGLGAFFTAAINGPKIEDLLGLDAVEEGAIGICGCGIPAAEGPLFGLDFEPFSPRRAKS